MIGELTRLFSGDSQIASASVPHAEWTNLILQTVRELQMHLHNFKVFRPITEPMDWHYSETQVRWAKALAETSNRQRIDLLDVSGWPARMSRDTHVVRLYKIHATSKFGHGGTIILTREGTLWFWKWYGTELNNYLERLERSELVALTVGEMGRLFEKDSSAAQNIYRALCYLPQTQEKILEQELQDVRKLSGKLLTEVSYFE